MKLGNELKGVGVIDDSVVFSVTSIAVVRMKRVILTQNVINCASDSSDFATTATATATTAATASIIFSIIIIIVAVTAIITDRHRRLQWFSQTLTKSAIVATSSCLIVAVWDQVAGPVTPYATVSTTFLCCRCCCCCCWGASLCKNRILS